MYYLFFKVPRSEICKIKSILESYEHMMTVSTVDKDLPKIQVTIAPDFLEGCQEVIREMQKEILMIPLDEPNHISQGKY